MNRNNGIFFVALCLAIFISSSLIAVEAENGIDTEFHVTSGEAELYIKVRGQDINNPVLLYLHGGPGEANGPLLFQAYAGPELEKHYVVGYLHQRNTCISPDAPVKTITIKQFVKDVDVMVTFLKEEFKKDRIFLLGHSFGGGLGLLYLLEHEDNIKKFVCAGGAFSTKAIENNGYQTVMEMSKKTDNQQAVKQLENVGPPPYETFQEGIVWRMLAMSLLEEKNEGLTKNLQISKVISITGIQSIDPDWQRKSMVVVNTMWKELGTIDFEDKVQSIGTPMLLMTGAKDIMVPFRILEKGYKNYGGEKEYFILENSNHMMFVDEPELFVSTVIEYFKS
ncbi:MAG: alpha/beta hydrolase [Candidatus Krumholzibacteria bacterium]|nr:alpha/beta hydrolase [Candidatus Krumholzibacteria bacterium]